MAMDHAMRYDHAAQYFAATLEASDAARDAALAAREALALHDPTHPAVNIPLREYAILQAHPLALLAEVLFGCSRDREAARALTPQVALLAGSYAIGQGMDPARVLEALRRVVLERVEAPQLDRSR